MIYCKTIIKICKTIILFCKKHLIIYKKQRNICKKIFRIKRYHIQKIQYQKFDLKLFSRELSQDDLLALKRLFVRYLADKATQLADDIFIQKGWTNDDMNQLAHTHLRTPYKKQKDTNPQV